MIPEGRKINYYRCIISILILIFGIIVDKIVENNNNNNSNNDNNNKNNDNSINSSISA